MTQQLSRPFSAPVTQWVAPAPTPGNTLFPPIQMEAAYRQASAASQRAHARAVRLDGPGKSGDATRAAEAAAAALDTTVDEILQQRLAELPAIVEAFPAEWLAKRPPVQQRRTYGLCHVPVDTVLRTSPDFVHSLLTLRYARPGGDGYERIMRSARKMAIGQWSDDPGTDVPELHVSAGPSGEPQFSGSGRHRFIASVLTGRPDILATVHLYLIGDTPERSQNEDALDQWFRSIDLGNARSDAALQYHQRQAEHHYGTAIQDGVLNTTAASGGWAL